MTLRFVPTPLEAGPQGDLGAALAAQRSRRFPPAAASALVADGPAATALRALLDGRALAVTTGQQAGLFTGPLLAIHKALSCAAAAELIAESVGAPVVPVFWVAGDDHDFSEINHCDVLAADGRPARIVLRERLPDAPMLPAYREPVGPEGARALAALEAALPPSQFRADTLAWLERAYQPDRSLAEACAAALAELLGRFGVVVCRGWAAALKAEARPALLGALRGAEALDAALHAEADRLRAAGQQVPVEVGEGLTLLMLEGRLGRDRLRFADGRFVTRRGGETYTLGELERIAAAEPERLSANVLLRPAMEAQLFPSVAYVGGPGELAYLAQAGPVFAALDVPRPARLPRLSGSLVEAKVDKALERFGLGPGDLARPEGELESAVVKEGLPAGASAALESLRAAITERYAALGREARAIERTLEKPVESARNEALAASQEIEKKLISALKRLNETSLQQLTRARQQLYPHGKPQERVYTVASFMARHGTAALDVVHDAARRRARRLLEAPLGAA